MNFGRTLSKVFFVVLFALVTAWSARAAENNFKFSAPRVYTKGTVEDYTKDADAKAAKGAVYMVWEKNQEVPKYELEIYRVDKPDQKQKVSSERHTTHLMLYFDQNYLWHVRYMDNNGQPLSDFSEEAPLKVVRAGQMQESPSMEMADEDTTPAKGKALTVKGGEKRVEADHEEYEEVVVDVTDGESAPKAAAKPVAKPTAKAAVAPPTPAKANKPLMQAKNPGAKAAADKAKIEAEQKAAIAKAKQAAADKAKREADQKAAVEKAKQEAAAKAAQEKAQQEAQAKAEAEKVAAEKAQQVAAAKAAEEQAKKEAADKAAEEQKEKEDAEKKAADEKRTSASVAPPAPPAPPKGEKEEELFVEEVDDAAFDY